MTHLSLTFLGPFQVTLGGRPATDFKSNKVRALLAYLAVEAERPHGRETLAGLLWPDWPDRDALSNLRYALSNLRRAIADHSAKPPFLLITRDTLQFNTTSDYALDVATFTAQTEAARIAASELQDLAGVEQALALYQGDFLEGFPIKDSLAFEEWVLLKRQQYAQRMMSALRYLATANEQLGQYDQAQAFCRRQLELEPWDEAAHRQMMRTLALSGQRSAAIVQYETCRRLLAEELGVEPTEETNRLHEQIRSDGLLPAGSSAAAQPIDLVVRPPAFLEEEPPQVEAPIFVSRERELAQLKGFLDQTLAGKGRVAFVTGEAGSGKTTLVQEFSRRAQEIESDLGVVSGGCNAYTGIGDPYLPFREILELLTGDVEARWVAGSMTHEQARRLWQRLPFAATALAEAGPDLIDTFIPGAALLERVKNCTPGTVEWLARLEQLVESRNVAGPGTPSTQQNDLFEQYARVLQALAQQEPLLLVLDDLQWADLGSISLLFHLGRHLAGSRILIVGAYRHEEVAIGRNGERHPLDPVVNEFQRVFGDVTVSLGQAEKRAFMEAFLDNEPNELGSAFREMLFRQTRGHPLFTIELIRGLQERGDLVLDAGGRWIEGPALNWERMPARVEAVIAERIGRLARPLQAILRVASVEGETFTAEVVARVQAADQREIVTRLSRELDRQHRLVRAQATERHGSRRLSHYRFRNYLFQKYLHESLDQVERAYLHEDVGNVLEDIYTDQDSKIAVQLAWHFQEAGIAERAISYLQKAGERAVRLSAYQDGVTHLTQGLALLMDLPDTPERARQELSLQLALGMASQGIKGARSTEMKQAYTRAYELCQQTGQTAQLCRVLADMVESSYVGAEHQRAHELAEESLRLAEQARDPLLIALGHWYTGITTFALGELESAHAHFEQVTASYEPQAHHVPYVTLRGKDAGLGALAYEACCLWCFGYPDTALKRGVEALALAQELAHPFTMADVTCFAGCLIHELNRDADALKEHAEELMRLSREIVFGWRGTGDCYLGEALVMLGSVEEGMEQIEAGLAIQASIGVRCYVASTMGFLAEAQASVGEPDRALDTLGEALALVEATDERFYEAELHRRRGEFLMSGGKEAEASLRKGVEVARRQGNRLFELRSATSLARLLRKQDRKEEAREMLGGIYEWFTEGFETPDLKEAKLVLDKLEGGHSQS